MKKCFPILLVALFPLNASAQTAPLFRFTEELTAAAKDCSPYEEEFSETNPILKTITTFFGLDDIATFIRIKGKNDKGVCDFSIVSQTDDIVVSDQTCSVLPEQLTEIHNAMTDQGNTDLNAVWQKISEKACEKKKIDFSKQDMEKLQRKMFALPKNFIESLHVCRPDKAEKNVAFFAMTAEITGVKDGLCQIKMPPFAFSLNKKHVRQIATWMDFYSFAGDSAIAAYVPEYSTIGLSGAMKACALGDKTHEAGSESGSFGDVKISKGLSSAFSDDICTVTFKNTVEINGQTADHSKICKISKADLLKMLPVDPEKEKEQGFSISLPFSEEERKLSDELYEKLTGQNLCR